MWSALPPVFGVTHGFTKNSRSLKQVVEVIAVEDEEELGVVTSIDSIGPGCGLEGEDCEIGPGCDLAEGDCELAQDDQDGDPSLGEAAGLFKRAAKTCLIVVSQNLS